MSNSTRIQDLGKDFGVALRGARRVLWSALGVALAAWLLSGMSCIEANQVGFVRRFGKVVRRDIEPGFTFLLPWPIEQLDTVPRKDIRRAEGGFSGKTVETHVRIKVNRPPEADIPYCLTGDRNIIHISMVAQYQIKDPYRYSYQVVDADAVLVNVLNDAVLTCAAEMTVDGVLTTEKEILRARTRQLAQTILDELGTGLLLADLQLETPPTVPKETEAAFQRVMDAKSGMETAKYRAEQYRKQVVEDARGTSARISKNALAYKEGRIGQALADTEAFRNRLAEYEKNPYVARLKLYLDTVGAVMSQVKTYVLPEGQPVPVGRGDVRPPTGMP